MVFYGLSQFFVFLTPTDVYQCFLVESLQQPSCIPLKPIYTGPTQQARSNSNEATRRRHSKQQLLSLSPAEKTLKLSLNCIQRTELADAVSVLA